MTICWYCYWGWAKPVAEIYIEALKKLDGNEMPLHYGPAHIVWEDENWDSVVWCIEHFDECKGDNSEKELEVVRWSLEQLAKIPLKQREIEPNDYDGENPEKYPPPEGVEVVRV